MKSIETHTEQQWLQTWGTHALATAAGFGQTTKRQYVHSQLRPTHSQAAIQVELQLTTSPGQMGPNRDELASLGGGGRASWNCATPTGDGDGGVGQSHNNSGLAP